MTGSRVGRTIATAFAVGPHLGSAAALTRFWSGVIRLAAAALAMLAGNRTTATDAAATAASSPAAATEIAARPDRIIVRPNAGADRAALRRLYAALGCRIRQTFPHLREIAIVEIRAGDDPTRIIAALQASRMVEYAERDTTARALMVPNDPYYGTGELWGLNNTGANGGRAGSDIMADEGWNVVHDATNIIVAVIDSGVRYTHEDLAGNMWVNPGEAGLDSAGRDKRTNGLDDDGDGYIDDVYGINVLTRSGNPDDDFGHGSHVAGTIGAVGNNGTGITGVAWRVKILACKFIDSGGNYSVSDAITSLDYARAKGAKVVTAAWGGYTFASAGLRDALIALRDANIIVAAAAGNDGTNNDTSPLYPASYDFSNVIAVAATDRSDARAAFSNYGARSVDLGAPGKEILSCWNRSNTDYATVSGTSMAAAHVAGACALLWARFPGDSHQQIINRILSTVDPLPGLTGQTVSGGRLNLAAALTSDVAPTITTVIAPAAGSYRAGQSLWFTVNTTAAVVVTGSPRLSLTIGSAPQLANYAAGSGTAALVFTYVIAAGDNDSDGITFASSAIDLNGGTIRNGSGANLALTFTAPATSGIRVDTTAPAAPVFTGIADDTETPGDQITSDGTLILHGTAEPGGIVTVARAGTGVLGSTTAGTNGIWAYDHTSTALGAGSYQFSATVQDAAGNVSPASPTFNVTVIAAGGIPVVASGTVYGSAGTAIPPFQISASNNPTAYAVMSGVLPGGLSLNPVTGIISGTPIAASSAIVTVGATNATGTGTGTITFAIAAAPPPPPPAPPPPPPPATTQSQTITFPAPADPIFVNQPVSLSGSATSGLPLTYAVVSGNAVVTGMQLTIRDTNPVIVRATQPGNSHYSSATTTATFTALKAPQRITVATPGDQLATERTVNVAATASSGLPVSCALVSGPATINGTTLTLSGAAGGVTLKFTQAGNESYDAAPEVLVSFAVRAVGEQIYFDRIAADPFAVVVSQDNTRGTLLVRFADSNQAAIARFSLAADGNFSVKVPGRTTVAAVDAAARVPAAPFAAAPAEFTFNGRVLNGVLAGAIRELNTTFSATVQPPAGPTAALAGLYVAAVPDSSSGETYIVVGPGGQAYALSINQTAMISGMGTVAPDGHIAVTTPAGTITAVADSAHGAVTGGATTAGVTRSFMGLAEHRECTDRLVNLSSRLRVVPGDASRAVVAGFVIEGTESRPVLVRAVGPGLAAFNVRNALANPRLQVFDASGGLVAENSGWASAPAVSAAGDRVGAFQLSTNSNDAALVVTLRSGAYTALVTSPAGAGGIVLIEVYDAAAELPVATRRLINLSTRGFVDTDEGALVAGFVVTGNRPKRVLIRGIGPTLRGFGVNAPLSDPVLRVFAAGRAEAIAQNGDWETPEPVSAMQEAATAAELAAATAAAGAFTLPSGSKDAAILITLAPGNYSAIMSGTGNSTGAGLVEVYEIGNP